LAKKRRIIPKIINNNYNQKKGKKIGKGNQKPLPSLKGKILRVPLRNLNV